MRRIRLLVAVLTLLAAYRCALGNEVSPPEREGPTRSVGEALEAESEPARESAASVAVVRLYRDPAADGKAFTRLDVPVKGRDVVFEAVASAGGAGTNLASAVVAVVPSDQRDPNVAAMLDGHVCAEPYHRGGWLRLEAGDMRSPPSRPCVFIDAARQPLPHAEVEIWLSSSFQYHQARQKVWIANARLDASGRMISPRTSRQTRLRYVLFVVLHPDCGRVPAVFDYYSSQKEVPVRVPALPKDKWSVFVDAMGNPMPGATVEVVHNLTWSRDEMSKRKREGLAPITLDEAGRLRPHPLNPTLELCCFLVSDPNYGIAIVEPRIVRHSPGDVPRRYVVPLTAVGTREDERSIWGTVTDADGVPVPDAVIHCPMVRTPLGGRLLAWSPSPQYATGQAKVLTDANGRFAMHLPLARSDGKLGRPVPPGASYSVTVEPPVGVDAKRYYNTLAAGQEHTIVLERASAVFTGTLVFEDEFGPVTDPEKRRQVILSINRKRPDGVVSGNRYSRGEWVDQEELPFGTYSATAEWDGKLYIFGPTEITAESPDVVTMEPTQIKAAQRLYCGRVLHGVTGEPLAGAVVMRRPDPHMFESLDVGTFQDGFYMGPELDPDGEIVRRFESCPELGVTRTDSQGRFETALPVIQQRSPLAPNLLVLKKDFLGAEQRVRYLLPEMDENGQRQWHEFEPDAAGRVNLPDLKLFPAAALTVEAHVSPNHGRMKEKDLRIDYFTNPDDPTPWLKDFWASPVEKQGASVFRKRKFPVNQAVTVYVPANVTLKVSIRRLSEKFAPFVLEDLHLRQGEVLDLGRITFPEAMRVTVRVVNAAGEPLEGINVRGCSSASHYSGRGSVSDGRGIAHVYVPMHSQGELVVRYHDRETLLPVRESAPYEVAGREDAGREFVLVLSDEFLTQLRQAGRKP